MVNKSSYILPRIVLFVLVLSGMQALPRTAASSPPNWELVPLYSSQYKPKKINEGFQMAHAMAYAPSDPSVVYLCTDTSRVWRSRDGGQTWQQSSVGMQTNGCRSLLVDPANPQRVIAAGFAGVNEEKARKMKWKLQGLYLTEDGGNSWRLVQKANFVRQISKSPLLAYDSSSTRNGRTAVWYAGDYDDGLYKSSDGGRTWQLIEKDIPKICAIEERPDKPGELLIATEQGLYSYNKQRLQAIGKDLPKGACAISILPSQPKVVIAAAGKQGLFRSVDGGQTFKPSNKGVTPALSNIVSMVVNKNPPHILFASTHASKQRLPFSSHDGGLTWKQGDYAATMRGYKTKSHFWFSSVLAPHPSNARQCLASSSGDGKIFKTDDGGDSWNLYGSGYTGARVMDMYFDAQTILVALTDFGLWANDRSDSYFDEIELPRCKGESSTHFIGQLADRKIATIGNWHEQCAALEVAKGKWRLLPQVHGRFRNMSIDPRDRNIVYIDDKRSLNAGSSWDTIAEKVAAIAAVDNSTRLYALKETKDKKSSIILVSDNKGDTWKPYTPAIPLKRELIHKLVPDPHNAAKLYLATSNGVWVFDGREWKQRMQQAGLSKDAFGQVHISSLIADPNRAGRLFAGRAAPGRGTSNGVFQSDDGGITWRNISGNLGESLYVWSLHFDSAHDTLYAGTDKGLVKLSLKP